MLALKPDIRLRGIQPEILLALYIADQVYEAHGEDCIITSVTDGQHMRGSLHHCGLAADLRLPKGNPSSIIEALRAQLGADFDVVQERDHLHLEYDPK